MKKACARDEKRLALVMKKVEGGRCRPQIALNSQEISGCVSWPATGVE